jgi:5-methylcytosine-specific restriction endonuclease McrA
VIYDAPPNHPTSATREHLVPKSMGGTNAQRNIVVACRQCNVQRMSDTAWRPYWRTDEMPYQQRDHMRRIGRLR